MVIQHRLQHFAPRGPFMLRASLWKHVPIFAHFLLGSRVILLTYSAVPDGCGYCATSGVQQTDLPGHTCFYDSETGLGVTTPYVRYATSLPPVPTPMPCPVVVLYENLLRYTFGTEQFRRPGSSPFLCGVTDYDVLNGGFRKALNGALAMSFTTSKGKVISSTVITLLPATLLPLVLSVSKVASQSDP